MPRRASPCKYPAQLHGKPNWGMAFIGHREKVVRGGKSMCLWLKPCSVPLSYTHLSCELLLYCTSMCFQAVEPEESEFLLWWRVGRQRHAEYKHDHCSVLKTGSSHYWGSNSKGKNVQKSITHRIKMNKWFFSGFIPTVNAHICFLEVADTVEATSIFLSYPKASQLIPSHWESTPLSGGMARFHCKHAHSFSYRVPWQKNTYTGYIPFKLKPYSAYSTLLLLYLYFIPICFKAPTHAHFKKNNWSGSIPLTHTQKRHRYSRGRLVANFLWRKNHTFLRGPDWTNWMSLLWPLKT